MTDLTAKLKTTGSSHEGELAQLRTAVAALTAEKTSLATRLASAEATVKSTEAIVKQAAAQKRDAEEKDVLLADLDKQVSDLTAKLKAATAHNEEVTPLKNEIASLKSAVETLTNEKSILTARVAGLDEMKKRAEADAKRASDAEFANVSLKADLARSANEAQTREMMIADMRTKMGVFSEKYKTERAYLESQVAQKEKELADLKRELSDVTKNASVEKKIIVDEKTAEVLSLTRSRDALAAECEQLRNRTEADAKDKKELQRLLADARRQLQENLQKLSSELTKK